MLLVLLQWVYSIHTDGQWGSSSNLYLFKVSPYFLFTLFFPFPTSTRIYWKQSISHHYQLATDHPPHDSCRLTRNYIYK